MGSLFHHQVFGFPRGDVRVIKHSIDHSICLSPFISFCLCVFAESKLKDRSILRIILRNSWSTSIKWCCLVDQTSQQKTSFILSENIFAVNAIFVLRICDKCLWWSYSLCLEIIFISFCQIVYLSILKFEESAWELYGIRNIYDGDSMFSIYFSLSILIEQWSVLIKSYTERSIQIY